MQRQYYVQVDSIQEMVYRTLRDNIMSFDLKPGATISTQDVANAFDVSRTPVREAFIRLQRENLVDITPQKTTTVSKIDLSIVRQERFVREALEIESLHAFIPVADSEQISTLRDNVYEQKKAIREKRYADYLALDNEFHMFGTKVLGMDMAHDLLRTMNGHYDRMRMISTWDEFVIRPAIEEHSMFVDCLEKKDVEGAERVLRAHLNALRVYSEKLINAWPDYFKERSISQNPKL